MKINNITFEELITTTNNKLNLKRQFGEHNDLQLYDRKRRHVLVADEDGFVEINPNGKYDLIRLDAIRTIGGDNDKCNSKKRICKDPNLPKKNKSAFMLFCDYIRNKTPNHMKSCADKMKWIGEKWRTLDQNNRKKFENMAKKEKEEYIKRMDEYDSNHTKKENNEDKVKIKKEEE